MKKLVLVLVLIFSAFVAAIFSVLMQKSLMEKIIPWWVNRQTTAVELRDLKIGRQVYSFPDAIQFGKVRIIVRQEKQDYSVDIGRIDARRLLNLLRGDQAALLDVMSFDVRASGIELQQGALQLALKLSAAGEEKVTGHARISSVRQAEYRFVDVSADLSGDLVLWRFKNFYAQFYGGQLRGEILLDSKNQMVYSVHMQAEEVDLKELQPVNPEFFSNVKGTVVGSMDITATPTEVRSISANFSASKGGEIKASLLNYLLQYIPANSSQRKDLEKLIKSDGNVPLNRASVEIKNLTDEKLSSRVKLFSERFNLDVDVTLDVSVEGGFQNLLNSQKNIIKLIGGTQ